MTLTSILSLVHLIVSINFTYPVHDLHVSRCEINYDLETEALQVTLNIFIDDLENALKKKGHENLFLCTEKESTLANQYIESYLKEKLVVSVDEAKMDMVYLGKETGDDIFAVWCYLEITNVRPVDQIAVKYDLLMELFEDQRNIVKVFHDNQSKAYFLFDRKNFTGNLYIE